MKRRNFFATILAALVGRKAVAAPPRKGVRLSVAIDAVLTRPDEAGCVLVHPSGIYQLPLNGSPFIISRECRVDAIEFINTDLWKAHLAE